ncbi:class I adenylate-forming enzyme family protein [Hydrogenophaga sp.]|uniref:class I adenylate-forming enzyme family protein n=1 Tax=Hydrogenophaga sp. TaxID=1904254 RepID=UPI002FCB070B
MNDMIECPELGTGQVGLPGATEVPRNAYDALQRCAAQWPDREGVVFPLANERLSFAQWLLQSNRLAIALRRLGVGEGDAVALWAENRAEWAVTLTALAGLGAVLVPINTHLLMNLMGCLSHGATYVGVPAFDAEHMFRIIDSERCTLLTGVPTSYLSMLQHPNRPQYDLSSLRAGTCGGADCDPTVLARCSAEFPLPGLVQVYGQTEASTLIALDTPDSPHRWETCGRPLDGMEVRIAHPDTRDCLPAMASGQIEVRGRMVMRPDGRVVAAGGRLRDMIIRGGENIYPVEVENLLREHPAVAEVAVFGLPDTYYGETVAAAVSLRGAASAAGFKAFLAGKVAAFKHPVHYFQVGEWPMTSSGKIKKRDLQTAALATQLDVLP